MIPVFFHSVLLSRTFRLAERFDRASQPFVFFSQTKEQYIPKSSLRPAAEPGTTTAICHAVPALKDSVIVHAISIPDTLSLKLLAQTRCRLLNCRLTMNKTTARQPTEIALMATAPYSQRL